MQVAVSTTPSVCKAICKDHVLAEGASADEYTTLLSQMGEQALRTRYLQTVALFEGQLLSRVRSLLALLRRRQPWLLWRAAFLAFDTIWLPAKSNDRGFVEIADPLRQHGGQE